GSYVARQRPGPAAAGGRALHQGIRTASYLGAAGGHRLHDAPAAGARSVRLLAVAGGQERSHAGGEPAMNPTGRIPLATIAHGRSGDKGNHANIAIIAYTPAGFDW